MSENPGNVNPPSGGNPATWYGAYEPELQRYVTENKWHEQKPEEALRNVLVSHVAQSRLLRTPADRLAVVPESASDPAYTALYDRVVGMSAPKSADEYDFKGLAFKDGTEPSADEVKFLRETAFKHKLSPSAARSFAQDMMAHADGLAANDANQSAVRSEQSRTALRLAWGPEFDQKSFTAERAAQAIGMPKAAFDLLNSLPQPEFIDSMNALVKLGAQLQEATMLRGGRGADVDRTAGMTPEEAQSKLDEFRSGKDQVMAQKYLAGDSDTVKYITSLHQIVAAARTMDRGQMGGQGGDLASRMARAAGWGNDRRGW